MVTPRSPQVAAPVPPRYARSCPGLHFDGEALRGERGDVAFVGAHLERPALREIAEAGEAVDRFQETPHGTLRINASVGVTRLVLVPIVLEFVRRYPEMHVDLVCDDRMVDIVAEGFDAGVRGPRRRRRT